MEIDKTSSLFLRWFVSFFKSNYQITLSIIGYIVFSILSVLFHVFSEYVWDWTVWISVVPSVILLSSIWHRSQKSYEIVTFVSMYFMFSVIVEFLIQGSIPSVVIIVLTAVSQIFLVLGTLKSLRDLSERYVFQEVKEGVFGKITVEVWFSLLITVVIMAIVIINQRSFNLNTALFDLGFSIFAFLLIISATLHFQYLCVDNDRLNSLAFVFGMVAILVGDVIFFIDITNEVRYSADINFLIVHLVGQFIIFLSTVRISRR